MEGKWLALFAMCLFLGGCAAAGGFPAQTVEETNKIPADKRIEISLVPGSFEVAEVEFHVDQSKLPITLVRRAKERMKLSGDIDDCEIEYHGGQLFYEITGRVDGKEQEVMFTADGQEYRWENEVDPKDVPKNVMSQAGSLLKGAVVKKAEQILDPDWNPLAYHFKMEKDGIKYKVVIPLAAGEPSVVYRETIAEIEVPVKVME